MLYGGIVYNNIILRHYNYVDIGTFGRYGVPWGITPLMIYKEEGEASCLRMTPFVHAWRPACMAWSLYTAGTMALQ